MKQKIFKTGNSLTVVIPAAFAKIIGVRAGDEVDVKIEIEKAEVKVLFPNPRQLQIGKK